MVGFDIVSLRSIVRWWNFIDGFLSDFLWELWIKSMLKAIQHLYGNKNLHCFVLLISGLLCDSEIFSPGLFGWIGVGVRPRQPSPGQCFFLHVVYLTLSCSCFAGSGRNTILHTQLVGLVNGWHRRLESDPTSWYPRLVLMKVPVPGMRWDSHWELVCVTGLCLRS